MAQRPVPTQRGARAYTWLMHDGRKKLATPPGTLTALLCSIGIGDKRERILR
jgi:hypothetical protein